MTTYLTASPKRLPIGTIQGVTNADGTVTIISGAAYLAAATAMNRPATVTLISGSASVTLANTDRPDLNVGSPTAADVAAAINADVAADQTRGGRSWDSYGAFRTDDLTNAVHRLNALSPSAALG